MERLTFIIVALALAILTGCQSTERRGIPIDRVSMPDWARTGDHPEYSSSEYLVVYGFARDMAEAREMAERRLEGAICNHVRTRHASLFKDTHFAEVVTLPAAWFDVSEFGTGVVEDAASDGFESVALRGIGYGELSLRAKSLLPDAVDELNARTMPPPGIGSVGKRMELWGDYFLRAVRVVCLELLATDTLNRTVFDKLEEATLVLWELPAIMDVARTGGGQHVQIRGGVQDELKMYASFRGSSLEGVPIQWGPAPGFSGDVQGDRELDENGQAGARVLYMQPNGSEIAYVGATLDLDAFMGRRMGIALNLWLWKLTLPHRGNAELVIDVTEKVNGESEGVDPTFVPELEKWCSVRGLATAKGEPSNKEFIYRLKLTGEIDVISSVREGPPGTEGQDVPTAYATGTLTLSDTATGQVLFRYTLGIRKTGDPGSKVKLVQLGAAQEGTADIMVELASRLISTLPSEKKNSSAHAEGASQLVSPGREARAFVSVR